MFHPRFERDPLEYKSGASPTVRSEVSTAVVMQGYNAAKFSADYTVIFQKIELSNSVVVSRPQSGNFKIFASVLYSPASPSHVTVITPQYAAGGTVPSSGSFLTP